MSFASDGVCDLERLYRRSSMSKRRSTLPIAVSNRASTCCRLQLSSDWSSGVDATSPVANLQVHPRQQLAHLRQGAKADEARILRGVDSHRPTNAAIASPCEGIGWCFSIESEAAQLLQHLHFAPPRPRPPRARPQPHRAGGQPQPPPLPHPAAAAAAADASAAFGGDGAGIVGVLGIAAVLSEEGTAEGLAALNFQLVFQQCTLAVAWVPGTVHLPLRPWSSREAFCECGGRTGATLL
mmetsp:Transcript_163506/g.524256  ORF Transcript_163506/g.524256 Transcript_163506/m.524256 type:complete len:239 (+) Transcript_163506:364-1080(+)